MGTILEALRELKEDELDKSPNSIDDNSAQSNVKTGSPEEMEARFHNFCINNGLDKKGEIKVYVDNEGNQRFTIVTRHKVEGNDLFDITDVEPDPWGDEDEDGRYGGVNADFNEYEVEEYFEEIDGIWEEDFDSEEFNLVDREVESDNEIEVDSYSYDPGNYWNPPEGEFELGGEFISELTYYFEPNPKYKLNEDISYGDLPKEIVVDDDLFVDNPSDDELDIYYYDGYIQVWSYNPKDIHRAINMRIVNGVEEEIVYNADGGKHPAFPGSGREWQEWYYTVDPEKLEFEVNGYGDFDRDLLEHSHVKAVCSERVKNIIVNKLDEDETFEKLEREYRASREY